MTSKAERPADAVGFGEEYRARVSRLERRAEFASMAMQALLTRGNYGHMEDILAEQSVRYADALIKELSK